MAKLERMPDSATIMAARKRVDFYLWKDIPCARSWPKKSVQPRTAGEIQSSNLFAAAAIMTGALDPKTTLAWKRLMQGKGTGVTWVDAFRAAARQRSWVETHGS